MTTAVSSKRTYDKIEHWTGIIKFKVRQQKPEKPFIQKLLRQQIVNGDGGSKALRFQCRIAQDANEVFRDFEYAGKHYTLDSSAKGEFGRKESSGLTYLAVGLISETGEKYRLTWEGDNVPLKMMEAAVRHDQGLGVKACAVALDLGKARVVRRGHRPGQVQARKVRHRDKNGVLYSKRKFGRTCPSDLVTA